VQVRLPASLRREYTRLVERESGGKALGGCSRRTDGSGVGVGKSRNVTGVVKSKFAPRPPRKESNKSVSEINSIKQKSE